MNMKELYWAAGFLEGDGGFRDTGTTEGVYVVQVQKEPLERIQKLFGGTIRRKTYKGKSPGGRDTSNWHDAWRWYCYGTTARGIIMTLYPLMSEKRKWQMRKALRHLPEQ